MGDTGPGRIGVQGGYGSREDTGIGGYGSGELWGGNLGVLRPSQNLENQSIANSNSKKSRRLPAANHNQVCVDFVNSHSVYDMK